MKRLFAGLFLAGVLILAVAYLAAEEDPARAPAAAPKADAGENAAVREAANGADAGGKETAPEAPAAEEKKSAAGGERSSPFLFLVNRNHPVAEDYDPDIITVPGRNVRGERTAAEALRDMLAAGEKEGLRFVVCSGYRTRDEQRKLYLSQIQRRLDAGMTQTEAVEEAGRVSAQPGTSEHETGLAFDIVALSYQNLDDGYALTAEAKWLRAHAAEYGFVLRYPAGKSDATGMDYEPWHFRYVGKEAAEEIEGAGLTLEEYLGNEAAVSLSQEDTQK